MKEIYFDNSSTSFPKPKEVIVEVNNIIENSGFNINRGGYEGSYNLEDMVFETRELLSSYFDGYNNVVFTKNITESLNILTLGYLKEGDDVLISSMEHNAIYRPINYLKNKGVTYSIIPCNEKGELNISAIKGLIKKNTKAIYLTHCSNVCGTLMPLKKVGEICKENNLKFFVDSAQSAGIVPISLKDNNISALGFTGHKGLLGLQGIGGIIFDNNIFNEIEPIIYGGTGSFSHLGEMPRTIPDKFESGTLNIPAIASLNSSIKWLNSREKNEIINHDLDLTLALINGILEIDNKEERIKIIGKKDKINRIGVVSLDVKSMDIGKLGYILDSEYKIMSRVGLHCAPLAHKTLKTYPKGTIRFSFGYNNTKNEVLYLLEALRNIIYN